MSLPPSHIEIEDRTIIDAKDILKVKPPTQNFTPLDEVTSDRYLVVILDNKLSFNEHVDTIAKKAPLLFNLCRRNLYMCSPQVKEIQYKLQLGYPLVGFYRVHLPASRCG